MKAQDEGELFDLCAPDGAPLGRAKARALVHRDGDWHKSVHVWVWGVASGQPHLVLQRRSAGKDTWPGALDVAVTGHVRAGETIEAALREAEEEIGLPLRPADVARLGRRRRPERRAGVIDNELQEIFAAVAPATLEALRPDPAELSAILAVPFADAERVLRGGEASGLRLELAAEGGAATLAAEQIHGRELVPAKDGYYDAAFASLAALVSGGRPAAWAIG